MDATGGNFTCNLSDATLSNSVGGDVGVYEGEKYQLHEAQSPTTQYYPNNYTYIYISHPKYAVCVVDKIIHFL